MDRLVQRLRDRKALLERDRVEGAALARARFAVGAFDLAEESRVLLQSMDIERDEIEAALDEALALVRPGAERRRDMRTRAAAMALAQERLARVRKKLLSLAGPAADERIDVRRPRIRIPGEDEVLPERGRVTLSPR